MTGRQVLGYCQMSLMGIFRRGRGARAIVPGQPTVSGPAESPSSLIRLGKRMAARKIPRTDTRMAVEVVELIADGLGGDEELRSASQQVGEAAKAAHW